MPQHSDLPKLSISTILAGTLLCSFQVTALAALNDPDNTTPPVLDTTAPSAITINKPTTFSNNRYDKDDGANRPTISLDFKTQIAETVEVADENTIIFSPTGTVGPLLPGSYEITWTATDLGFNTLSVAQTLEVLPALNLSLNQTVDEGGTAIVTAYLSGRAPDAAFEPSPPGTLSIPYTVTGSADASDHGAINGNFVFSPNDTEASISFPISDDGISDSGETIVITLGTPPVGAAFAGHKTTHTITISETDQAPLAQLFATQDGKKTRVISNSGGTVTLSADTYDANGDTVLYDWSASDNVLAPTSGTNNASFTFDPQELNPGFYTVRLTVSDASSLSSTYELLLVLLDGEAELTNDRDRDDDKTNDLDEGIYDDDNDGIPNYLDALTNPTLIQAFEPYLFEPTLIQNDTLVTGNIELTWEIDSTASNLIVYPLLVSTEPSLQVNIGPTAFASSNNYARMSTTRAEQLRGIPLDDNLVSADGQVLDIEITNLPEAGSSARVIVPQAAPLPASQSGAPPEFIVFTRLDSWETFTADGNNQIVTKVKSDSYCSGFDEAATYTNTLDTGDECLMITIQDGGPNDYDGVANGSIHFMGSVFVSGSNVSSTTQVSGETFSGNNDSTLEELNRLDLGTGGGGYLGLASIFGLLSMLLFRRRHLRSQ